MKTSKPTDARSLSPEAQQALRERVVRRVLEGMTQVEAARVFGVSRAAVAKWMASHRAGGPAALASRPKGRPAGKGLLAGWQAAQIVRTITDHTPDQIKMPFVLWTRQAVADLIEARFGLRLSVWTVGRLLARWGMTPQKPARRAWERDPERVGHWLEVEYPRVREQARAENAQIHWGDEMGLRSDHQAGTSYAPRGRTPVVAGTGQRWRCNVISSITGRGVLRFMVFKRNFTADVFIEFLRRLVRDSARRIVLIVDGHPAHKAARVARWLARHADRIRLVILPAYCPELNPDEMLNHDVKQNAVGRRRAASRDELMANVRGYLGGRQKRPHLVRRYFHAPSVRYAMV